MRRIPRLERSIDLSRLRLPTQKYSPYVCTSCRHQVTSFSTSTPKAVHKKPALTEKVRRKIWGTDNPPGLEDPYGDLSRFDQTKKGLQKTKLGEEIQAAEHENGIGEQEELGLAATLDDGSYEPATTWDGLEEVGEYDSSAAWDAEHGFRSGFSPNEVMRDSYQITAAFHRALVEVLVLDQAGKPLSQLSDRKPGEDMTREVQIFPLAAGVELKFSNTVSMEELVGSLTAAVDETIEKLEPTESEEDIAADRSEVDPLKPSTTSVEEIVENEHPTESEEDIAADRSETDPLKAIAQMTYKDLVKSWDPFWRLVSLEDTEIKFAVMKRMFQLSGIRFPDAAIKSSRTAGEMLQHVMKPPKPRKLIEELAKKEKLLNLPNVSVFAKRVTPIDKEKSVGRWKVIEQELERRGLPITGHD